MPGGVLFLFVVFIGLAIVIRLIAGSMDDTRVEDYIRARGGRMLNKEWAPFGKGWVGEKDSRIYRVAYVDAEGATHQATCKTSLFSGVYFTEDHIVREAPRGEPRPAPAGPEPATAETGAAGGATVEERLRTLDRLRSENWISAGEHAEQRRRILERL